MTDDQSFASATLARHLTRGVIGFGALAGAFALIPVIGPVSLVLLPVSLLALRGCPTCWAIGLMQTISRGKLQRSCVDGRCQLTTPNRSPSPRAQRRTEPTQPAQQSTSAGAPFTVGDGAIDAMSNRG